MGSSTSTIATVMRLFAYSVPRYSRPRSLAFFVRTSSDSPSLLWMVLRVWTVDLVLYSAPSVCTKAYLNTLTGGSLKISSLVHLQSVSFPVDYVETDLASKSFSLQIWRVFSLDSP